MSGKKSMIAIALLLAISILALLFVSGNIHMESEQKDALKITFLKVGKVDAIIAQTQEKTMVMSRLKKMMERKCFLLNQSRSFQGGCSDYYPL